MTTATVMAELANEARMGAQGSLDTGREVRRIDLSDFDARKAQIADELWDACVHVGFFQLVNHGIALERIREAFAMAERFFALPDAVKAQYPHSKANNVGWESRAQVRPSTGTPDQKESYQITRPHMGGLWPSDAELPAFKAQMLDFERQCWTVAMRVLSCFAYKMGFSDGFFAQAHDPEQASYQSTLRLLHYFAIPPQAQTHLDLWRAGAHTDFDCLTLLFQRPGQGGLEVCPGKDMESQAWTPVEPDEAAITCNIGDMLMRWSDDQIVSNFHRVRNPKPGEYMGPRYSIAFFAQANRDALIQGPLGKYPSITAGEYLRQRVAANFRAAM
jgi:isopenicillin N synthase-like dioxygenase